MQSFNCLQSKIAIETKPQEQILLTKRHQCISLMELGSKESKEQKIKNFRVDLIPQKKTRRRNSAVKPTSIIWLMELGKGTN